MLLVHDQRISSTLLSCTEVKGSPDECIVTGHGFERKSWGQRKREDGLIEASNHAVRSVTASALE